MTTPKFSAPLLLAALRQPVDGAGLALFRILFGGIVLYGIASTWAAIPHLWPELGYRFPYPGLEWIQRWPGDGLYWHFGLMGVAALGILLGLFYRVASVVFFLCLAYVFLLDQGIYQNQLYLICLMAFVLCWLPANRVWSLDARLFSRSADFTVPRWAPASLALLVAVPLVYMGVSRLGADWLEGYPFRIWFKQAASGHMLRSWAGVMTTEWFAMAWSYFGLLLFLSIVPMLLWRRTRWLALVLFVLYHAGLSVIFEKPIVPAALLAGMLLFFPADGPRKLLARIRRQPPPAGVVAAAAAVPASRHEPLVLGALGLFMLFHILFPARSLLYPGVSAWTGDGYRFAWRMMLDDKHCEVRYVVKDPASGRVWEFAVPQTLPGLQRQELNVRPDMMVQFAQQTAAQWQRQKKSDSAEVYAKAKCSLNSRPYSVLVDRSVDLSKLEVGLGPSDWVEPLDLSVPTGWRVVGPGR